MTTMDATQRRDLCCPYCAGPIRPDWQSDSYGFGFRCEACEAHWDAGGDLMEYPSQEAEADAEDPAPPSELQLKLAKQLEPLVKQFAAAGRAFSDRAISVAARRATAAEGDKPVTDTRPG